MDPKGYVLCKKEFTATKLWPNSDVVFSKVNLEAAYKRALAGKVAMVLDISVDGTGYLVYSKSEEAGEFIWTIEKEDTVTFVPVIWKYGILMPAGMTAAEEYMYLLKHQDLRKESEPYKKF